MPGLDSLEAPFLEQEAKYALWAMRVDSSPGPDGFGPAFFRTFWQDVRGDIMAFLQEFHAGDARLDGVNRAYIALLPKKRTSSLPMVIAPSHCRTVL